MPCASHSSPGHPWNSAARANIFADVLAAHDDFCDKALEGFTMFALSQGPRCAPAHVARSVSHLRRRFWSWRRSDKAVRQGDR